MDRQYYLFAYDVSENRRRVKLCDMAQRFATGGQKSAYECWLSPAEASAIRSFSAGVIEEAEDSVMMLRLDVRAATRQLGRGQPPSDPDIFIFG